MKKIYSKPEILVVESQIECNILAGSSIDQDLGKAADQGVSNHVTGAVSDESNSTHEVFGKRTSDLWE